MTRNNEIHHSAMDIALAMQIVITTLISSLNSETKHRFQKNLQEALNAFSEEDLKLPSYPHSLNNAVDYAKNFLDSYHKS